ncbi:MAG: aromatic amino acid transport family protein, partial [Patescibacteria group bacterium]
MIYRNLILPASLLSGTIVGAGMFALPFIFNKAGLGLGFFYLIFFGIVSMLVHLMYADIILRTQENHRFAGYAKIYFGELGFWSGFLMTVVGAIFSLLVYLVLSVSFINLVAPIFPDNYEVLIFWFFGSMAFFLNINKITYFEFLTDIGMWLIILAIIIYGFFDFKLSGPLLMDANYFFFPYGAILFSLAGRVAIPAVLGYFRNNNKSPALAKKPIILGSLTPIIVYAVFVLGVLGLSTERGPSEDSISGLASKLPPEILYALIILGAISLWSTYIVIGRDVKKSLEHDLNLNGLFSALAVSIIPLLLYFAGFDNFIKLISLVGGIFIGLEAIFIVLMWQRASKTAAKEMIFKKINPLIIYSLIFVFVGGIIYALIY